MQLHESHACTVCTHEAVIRQITSGLKKPNKSNIQFRVEADSSVQIGNRPVIVAFMPEAITTVIVGDRRGRREFDRAREIRNGPIELTELHHKISARDKGCQLFGSSLTASSRSAIARSKYLFCER